MNLFNLRMIQIDIFLMYTFATIHNSMILSYLLNIKAICLNNIDIFFLKSFVSIIYGSNIIF